MRFVFKCLLLGLLFTTGGKLYAQFSNINEPHLAIKLPTSNGDSLSLASLKGNVVLVDFWASWCVPCRVANRQMVKLYKQYREKGFEIFAISFDEDPADWVKAIKKDKITWPQVIATGFWDSPVARSWKVESFPSTFLVNKKGEVVAKNLSHSELKEWVEKLLAE